MKIRYAWKKPLIVLSLSLVSCIPVAVMTAPQHLKNVAFAFTGRDLTVGSQGYDVDELQNRLHFLGFYHSQVDGQFGWKTYAAVRHFQSQFGLPVTGRVSIKTKDSLVHATQAWHLPPTTAQPQSKHKSGAPAKPTLNVSHSTKAMTGPTVPGLSQSDLQLMAHVVYGEARGEVFRGEVAIAAVILNRIRSDKFPNNVSQVIYHPGAFTAVSDGQVNLQPDQRAMTAVVEAIHGLDPTHGALYYFNPATATSKWIWSRPEILKIGKHIFCR